MKFKKTAKLKWNPKKSFDASDDNLARVDSNDRNNFSFFSLKNIKFTTKRLDHFMISYFKHHILFQGKMICIYYYYLT